VPRYAHVSVAAPLSFPSFFLPAPSLDRGVMMHRLADEG
jgi:hypothetical protein